MIWLVGTAGLLGAELAIAFTDAKMDWIGTGKEVDICDAAALKRFVAEKPIDWIVNCAAYTNVDMAEVDRERCYLLNVKGPRILAELARSLGAEILHFSTNYVFDGNTDDPYSESDTIAPLGHYGSTKAEGESAVRANCAQHYIVRTAWLYGGTGSHFVSSMLTKMRSENTVAVVADMWGTPTWTKDLGRMTVELILSRARQWGTYHFTGGGKCSWYEFAIAIREEGQRLGLLAQRNPQIVALAAEKYPYGAKRPVFSVLSIDKIKSLLSLRVPIWRQSIRSFLEQEYCLYYPKVIMVTGGAGFIGSNFIRYLFGAAGFTGRVVNFDKLTYAGNQKSLSTVASEQTEKYVFRRGDVSDLDEIREVFKEYQIDTVVHFAAESHVDRSISGPDEFIKTNILGTYTLLKAAFEYWGSRRDVRFHHVSTDEVYGSLGEAGESTESSAYRPSNPYSASKASSDHLVMAYFTTFGLPTTISHSSNNFGPFQYHEKLIPLVIKNVIEKKLLPVYGSGKNRRDWLYVRDHVSAIWRILIHGRPGEKYNIGSGEERSNIDLVRRLCTRLAEFSGGKPEDNLQLIWHAEDRPGHDFRYALDTTKIRRELEWSPTENFDQALDETIAWYLANKPWLESVE